MVKHELEWSILPDPQQEELEEKIAKDHGEDDDDENTEQWLSIDEVVHTTGSSAEIVRRRGYEAIMEKMTMMTIMNSV